MKTVLASAATAIALGFVGSAAFAEEEYSFDVDVSRANTAAGAEALYDELQRHARRECSEWTRRPIQSYRKGRACEAGIIQTAVETIDRPLLTALHQGEARAQFADRSENTQDN